MSKTLGLAVAIAGISALGVGFAAPALANSCEKYKLRANGPFVVRQVVENETSGKLRVSWHKNSPDGKAAFTKSLLSGESKKYDFDSGGKKATNFVTVNEPEAICQVTTKNNDNDEANFYEASCDVGNDSYAVKCDRAYKSGSELSYWVITYTFFDASEGSDP